MARFIVGLQQVAYGLDRRIVPDGNRKVFNPSKTGSRALRLEAKANTSSPA
jgi:hypothetical protein